MVKVEKVSPDGPLGPSRVAPGDRLRAVNGEAMRDLLDIRFAAAEEHLELDFERPDGSRYALSLDKHPDDDLGLEFEPMPIRSCNNKCDFCFVFQQPKKIMRRDLYIMDDDYRYSFLYGNFVTLTNIDEADVERILAQRLSPLYISVHATDDGIRREFLRSPDAPPILPLLERLAAAGIRMHTQVVVVPDFNDGAVLERTIADLQGLHPMVRSLAVVPVGLTRYRLDLPHVKPVSRGYAQSLVKKLRERGDATRARLGTGFLYIADEFFLLAGKPFPRAPYYDDFAQIENGIGMCRGLLDHFTRGRRRLPARLDRPLEIHWVTGASAAKFVLPRIVAPLNEIERLTVHPVVVTNRFYGETVTVSGLLTGADILVALQHSRVRGGLVLLPPNCLNPDGLFLDDLAVSDLAGTLGVRVLPTAYDFVPQLRSLLLAPHSALRQEAA
jgi:putative radical SAM enzyme (TIGR03279 family)